MKGIPPRRILYKRHLVTEFIEDVLNTLPDWIYTRSKRYAHFQRINAEDSRFFSLFTRPTKTFTPVYIHSIQTLMDDDMSDIKNECLVSEAKLILRPLIGLMSELPREEIEHHVVREVAKHHRLRDEATMLEAKLDAAEVMSSAQETTRSYVAAMIAVHAQQTVVSTLLDLLGYVPNISRQNGH